MSGHLRKTEARNSWVREQESRACRRCGAEVGRQCVTASGTGSPRPHAERFNEAKAAAGEPDRLQEGVPWTRLGPAGIDRADVHVVHGWFVTCVACGEDVADYGGHGLKTRAEAEDERRAHIKEHRNSERAER